MTTSTHTPGPWAAQCNGPRVWGIYGAHTNGFVAETVADGATPNEQTAEANARLIAAAPDLLAALRDAEFLLRKAGQVAGPMQDSFNRSAADARAAITQAEGR